MTDSVSGQPDDTKVCPSCAEPVRAAARMCRFCGYPFDEVPVSATVIPRESVRGGGIAATVAGALLILGSFLPWASLHLLARTFRPSGVDSRAGTLTLLLGALLLVVGISALAGLRLPSLTGPGTIAAGVIAAVIGIWELARISSRLHTIGALAGRFRAHPLVGRFVSVHVGIGVWTVIAGGLVAIVSGVLLLRAVGQPSSMTSRSGGDQPAAVSA